MVTIEEKNPIEEEQQFPLREQIIKKLRELPDEIYKQDKEIIELQENINDMDFKGKIIKNQITLDVVDEKDEEGKPLYKNELARETKVSNRLEGNEQYYAIMEKIKKDMRSLKEMQLYSEYLKNKFSAAKYTTKLLEEENDTLPKYPKKL